MPGCKQRFERGFSDTSVPIARRTLHAASSKQPDTRQSSTTISIDFDSVDESDLAIPVQGSTIAGRPYNSFIEFGRGFVMACLNPNSLSGHIDEIRLIMSACKIARNI